MESFEKDLLELSMIEERAEKDALRREVICTRFYNLIDWHQVDVLRVPLYGVSRVAEICECNNGVDVMFLPLTNAHAVTYQPRLTTPPEPDDCNHCGAVLPLENATGECHRCAGQPDDVYPRNTVTVVS
jgi:hypothetical protein